MSVRLAVILVACFVAFLCAVTMAGGLWVFGLTFFWPALRELGVRLVDEGREARSAHVVDAELEAWIRGRSEA